MYVCIYIYIYICVCVYLFIYLFMQKCISHLSMDNEIVSFFLELASGYVKIAMENGHL